jgi:hypothetical protein
LSELSAANLSTSLKYRQNLLSASITQKFSTKNWMPQLRLNCKRINVSGQLPSTCQLLSSTTKWPTKFLAWMCMANCKWWCPSKLILQSIFSVLIPATGSRNFNFVHHGCDNSLGG